MARPKGDIEERIVIAARTRFLHEGVEGASLRSIASDAGTNVGMIYYYFPTKDELFLAVVESAYARLLDDLTQALQPELDVAERIHRVYRRFGELDDGEFDVVRIIAREALISSDRLRKLFDRFRNGHVPLLLATLQAGRSDGTLSPSAPLPAVFAMLFATAMVPQLVRRRLTAEIPMIAGLLPGPEALADALYQLFLHGAAAREG